LGDSAIKASAEAVREIINCSGAIGTASAWVQDRAELLLGKLRSAGYCVNEAKVETLWRLTLGLGSESASEIGFTLHRTGCPYLPASSLKGLARETARRAGAPPDQIDKLFGTQKAHGTVVFGDGYLCGFAGRNAKPLELDVMNPHFPEYYSGKSWPTEWQDPVPIVFLTVPPGSIFKIWVASRNQNDASAALKFLIEGLNVLGVGAKKAAGYGWFKVL
jgi:CRISPR-associated protein Cmr6